MRHTSLTAVVGCLLVLNISLLNSEAKVFTHCELARQLRRLRIQESQIAIWVCIAHFESRLNTSAVSQTGDHGIFQISDEYWCSPPGRGKGCGLRCAQLEDDDISDDVECVQTIFDEHQGLSGDGFNAWTVYPRCRKAGVVNRFLKKCASGSTGTENSIDSQIEKRGGSPQSKPRYIQEQSHRPSYLRPSYSQDYSYSSARTSASSFAQGYDYLTRSSPLSSTTRRPIQTVSMYSPSRPSSYSIGSVYYNPFETKSTTPAPVLYSFNHKKSFDNRQTGFAFKNTLLPQVYTTPRVYESYTRSGDAVFKTSSPAPIYKIKPAWADFPWWNGGK